MSGNARNRRPVLLGGATPSQSRAFAGVVPSGFLTARSAQDTFRSADSVAGEDLLPVERVPSDFSKTIFVRMPSAQEISASPRTPRAQEIPRAPSTLSIPGSRTVEGPRILHVWRDGLHTFVADKLTEESSVTQRDVCVLDLVTSLIVCCDEKADRIEKELATLVADLRSFSRALMTGSGLAWEATPSWTWENSPTSRVL